MDSISEKFLNYIILDTFFNLMKFVIHSKIQSSRSLGSSYHGEPNSLKTKISGEDYIFVIPVKSGSWDGETKKNIESSHAIMPLKYSMIFLKVAKHSAI